MPGDGIIGETRRLLHRDRRFSRYFVVPFPLYLFFLLYYGLSAWGRWVEGRLDSATESNDIGVGRVRSWSSWRFRFLKSTGAGA